MTTKPAAFIAATRIEGRTKFNTSSAWVWLEYTAGNARMMRECGIVEVWLAPRKVMDPSTYTQERLS